MWENIWCFSREYRKYYIVLINIIETHYVSNHLDGGYCMSIGIFENLGTSIGFTKDRFFGRIGDWYLLLVIVLLCIVTVGIPLLLGYFIRILRGDSSFKNIGQMFMDGIGAVVAVFAYLIPVVLVFLLAAGGGLAGIGGAGLAGGLYGVLAGGILWIILLFALAIIFGSMAIISLIRFAKEDNLSVVTEFRNNFRIAGEIGWLKIILSAIVCSLFMMVPYSIIILLGLAALATITTFIIPIICVILMIPALFCVPLVWVAVVKYWSNLYDSAVTTSP